MRYFDIKQLKVILDIGKSAEYWIGEVPEGDLTLLSWLRFDREPNGKYSISEFKVFDDGSSDFLDLYEFEPFDPETPYGEIHTFNDFNELVDELNSKFSINSDKFVNAGIIQDLYKEAKGY